MTSMGSLPGPSAGSEASHPHDVLANQPEGPPNEVLEVIFLSLSPAVLTSVARVCRQWRAVAEWFLYRNVSIFETLPTPKFPRRATLRWYRSIAAHPHHASSLRTLRVRWAYHNVNSNHSVTNSNETSCLSSAMSLLTNMESLDLDLGLPFNHSFAPFLLPGSDIVFPSLRNISLHKVGNLEHRNFVQFLHNTPSLQSLRLLDYRHQLSLDPDDLPSLTSFCGSLVTATTVLPERPVKSLALVTFWRSIVNVTEQELFQMTRTSVPLRYLDLSAYPVSEESLRRLFRHFSMMETLRVGIYTINSILDTPDLPVLEHLVTLKLLQTKDSNLTNSNIKELDICVESKKKFPQLRRVIFSFRKTWETWKYEQDGQWIRS